MITRSRKISVDDYPEHLNPFADDNEDLRNNRFNTTGRRRARPSLKDAWESNPSPALDVAVPVRGPTPARPPPPRLSLSPPPPPSEVQRQAPARPLTQPPPAPAPAAAADAAPAAPGKPSRRRFSFSRTLDAGSRLLLSPALLRRFRPGAAPASASAKPPPRDAQAPAPAAPDLRASIRRSQSQAIPTTPPPIADASGLNSRAGSNWTLAEGGFPQRIPSYRPKKRRAPPPPPQAPAPPAVTVSSPPHEISDTTNAEQQPEVGVEGASAEVTETTTVVVTVSAATPPPTSPGAPALVEVSITEGPADSGGPVEVASGVQEPPLPEAAAPLAEGEDDGDLAPPDASSQAQAEEQPGTEPRGTSAELPSSDTALSAEGSEQPAPLDTVPTPEAAEKEEDAPEVLEKTAGNSDTVEASSTAQGDAAVSAESSTSKLASDETVVEITPQVLTLTIREYKESPAQSVEVTEVSQESKDSVEAETKENVPVTGPEVANPTVEVELKVETAKAPEPAGATVGDVPRTETNAEQPSEDGDEVPDEPRNSALASFREDYLTKHYKGDLPVLQITESDLADEEERKEGSPVTKLSSGLPVLHISEEDLRDEPAVETEKSSEVAAAETTANGPSPAVRERDRESPARRSSLDGRRESPQPPPRQSSAQELNSKIYFRVLPPLAGSGGGGPPQLKTFSPPSSPPARGPKPQPPLRNGVAAPAAGEASPPRTKSPLPTPRRRHQPLQRDA